MPTFANVTPRLPVRNLRRTIAFYADRLGFAVDVLWPESNPTFTVLCRDATSVGFFQPTEHQPGPVGYAELYIEVTDSLGLYETIKATLPIEWGPEVYSYGRREFAVRDPNGYLVIFTEPCESSPTTNEPGDGTAG